MICPKCQTPNPEPGKNCLHCGFAFEGLPLAEESHPGELTSLPTMGGPSSFRQWADQSQRGVASVVLPAGLEIGHRYRVKSLLGMGGMGAVYLVHDKGLDRDVALKLIRSDIADDADALERFKREIQLSSRVTHSNVLRVFDLGESDGIQFLTMQFVDGRDLSTILKKQGKLPVERLLRVFRQTAEGLKAAHDQGVIHRDLKPQNIMVDSADHVYVTDFGMAKSSEQSGMTQTGAVIGTPFYMSPEQVKGEPVGPQSDIFSLGVILYQMATGTVPFSGATPFEVMMVRVQRRPKPAKELSPDLPVYLQKIIERCLAVDPDLRYQNVGQILADLDSEHVRSGISYRAMSRRWLKPTAAAVVVAMVLAGGGIWVYQKGRGAKVATQKPQSVLVADFANHAGDAVFDGTLEPAFTIALEGASFVSSYNRSAARKVAAQLSPGATGLDQTLARLVAVREGINVVTSGSIDKSGSGYEVSVRAIDAATGKTIVEDRESASGKEAVLATVARLAAKVRRALGDATPESTQLAAAETYTAGSLEAAHEYAVAQNLQWEGHWDEAIRQYQRALDLDRQPRPGLCGPGRRGEQSRTAPGRREELQGGPLPHRPDERAGEVPDSRRLLPPDPEPRQRHRRVLRPRQTVPGRHGRHREPGLRILRQAGHGQRSHLGAPRDRDLPEERSPTEQLRPDRDVRRRFRHRDARTEDGSADEPAVRAGVRRPRPLGARRGTARAGARDVEQARRDRPRRSLVRRRRAGRPRAVPGTDRRRPHDPRDRHRGGRRGEEHGRGRSKADDARRGRLASGQAARAVAAAERATGMSDDLAVVVSAARVLIEAGEEKKALAAAAQLAARLEPDPQMYAALLQGEADMKRRNYRDAIARLKEARKLADSWLVRYDLGRAYLEAGSFAEADAEFDVCVKRRGEAAAVYLDEVPTFRVFPPVYYYLGRAREGLKSPGAADAFKTFLGFQTGEGGALAADARRRLAGK